MEKDQEVTDGGQEDASAVKGWQEVYACLLLLERLAITLPTQVGSLSHTHPGFYQDLQACLSHPAFSVLAF